jgi:ABC-2 type transport system ATP-binding protein
MTTTTNQIDLAANQLPAGMVEIIRTEGLEKVYAGGVAAVNGLNLSVGRGEIFGLLGPNGAGKTTTVGMLTTRVIPTGGSAVVGGIDVVSHPALAKQAIGVVSQHNTLDRSLNVWENLYFHGRYFGMGAKTARAKTDEMLAKFRLSDRAKASVFALSGGMAQRLMVARAIFHDPAILFLDEPTAGLDPQSRIALWEILGELHDAGQTILLTTHYMEEADQLCSRVAIMDHGRILALDTPEGLKRSIAAGAEVTVRAEGDLGVLASHFGEMEGANDVRVVEDTIRIQLDDRDGALAKVVAAARAANFTLTDLSVTEPTLETVFISLTGKDLRE